MQSDKDQHELSFEEFAKLKAARRAELLRLPPEEAQAIVDSILQPRLWRVVDPKQLEWPGDLADDVDENQSS